MKQARRPVVIVATLLAATVLGACGTPKAGFTGGNGAASVNLYALADATGATKKVVDSCNASLGSQATITLHELTGDNQREQLTRRLSAKDTTIDLMAVPVSWTPEFAATGWAQELRGGNKTAITNNTEAAPLTTANYKKHLYAAPLTMDTQVLWYRKDLIPTPPTTWDDMISASTRLAKQNKPHFAEVDGLRNGDGVAPLFIGLTNSYGAGILDKSAKHAVVGNETKAAAALLHSFATSDAFDRTANTEATDTAIARFTEGNAAFLIASQNAFSDTNTPKNVAFVAWPKATANKNARPMLDGANLIISSYSKHQKQAFKALSCMRNGENLQTYAKAGQLPAKGDGVAKNGDVSMTAVDPTISQLITNGTAPLQTPVGDAVNTAIRQCLTPLENIDENTVNAKLQSSIDDALHFTAKN